MTVSTTASQTTVEGNGVTTSFVYSFIIPSTADVVITLIDNTVDPATSTVLLSSQYAITGIGNPAGGTVTYPLSGSPLAAGFELNIARVLPLQQLVSIGNQGAFFPQAIEQALDLLEMQIQQLAPPGPPQILAPYGIANVIDYGAMGDGDHDDAPAIRAAVAAVSLLGGIVFFPPGNYKILSTIGVAASGVRLIGSGRGTIIQVAFDTDDAISITGPLNNPEIGFLSFEGVVTRTGGAFIRVTNVHNFYFHDIVSFYSYDTIVIEGGAAQFIGNVERVEINNFTNSAYLLQDYPQDIFMRQLYGGTGGSGIIIRSASNVHVDMADFLSCTGHGVLFYADQALPIQNIFFNRVQADSGSDNGWLFAATTAIDTVFLTNCWAASSTAEGGFRVANTNSHNINFIGCIAANNYKTGFSLEGGSRHTLIGCQSLNNSQSGINNYQGIYVGAGVVQAVLIGNSSGQDDLIGTNLQQYGIAVDGAAENVTIVGNNLFGNATGGLSIGSGVTNANVTSNLGARTGTSATATITIGNTFVDVALGIEAPDSSIQVIQSPISSMSSSGVTELYRNTPSGGVVRFSVDTAVSGADFSFSWKAIAYGN